MIHASRLRAIHLALVLTVAFPPLAVLGQETEQGNQGVSRNARGPAVAGRSPGLWVRQALGGPEISQSREEAETPTKLQNIYIDFINALFAELNVLIPQLSAIFNPDGGGGGGGNLVITEIANDGTNSFVEIYNPSGLRIELDLWAFCQQADGCTGENELAGRVMEADDILVFQLGGTPNPADTFVNGVLSLRVDESLGELAIYDFADTDSRDPEVETAAMRGYVLWGETTFESFGLESVAVPRFWDASTNIESALDNRSFQLSSDRVDQGGSANDFIVADFATDSLGDLANSAPEGDGTETPPADGGTETPQAGAR